MGASTHVWSSHHDLQHGQAGSSKSIPVKPNPTAPHRSPGHQQLQNWFPSSSAAGAGGGGPGARSGSPYRVPRQLLDIHKNPHQLRDGHGRVRVIQLDGNLWGEQGWHMGDV